MIEVKDPEIYCQIALKKLSQFLPPPAVLEGPILLHSLCRLYFKLFHKCVMLPFLPTEVSLANMVLTFSDTVSFFHFTAGR